ncbi:UDP-N-acetylmuramoyl-tripeptide--D-alanyl-D-alanine ligase [Moorella thermoacetica]|uniref:Lipid II isoglutaminyl synthase (glutamine-hydrolyzing) subunit MurT n=1 Tax=Neomoorella thermoacetica TaxID=1525 RepID=A0AAC9HH24_NEOTH|nr:MurT ligase domain-containing protein [Moorella thermoacetica]AOQ23677.1 UDP-N-acetylmuramoylalanyl-D-glutamate--2,6-diaminopimelate ligase [Moorella thermoacetica]TYL13861.1 UDP-N-acetylmuramoyl-tripeptide--D-alanyl-D-alanine ligase [Moorella thermoacetica]
MLRRILAILAGRLVAFLCRCLKKGGTSLPGFLALKLDPDLIKGLIAGYRKVIIVTGTNGKTTTTNLLASILRASGLRVVSNSEGANMPAGVATALLGRRGEVAVLEVDEGSLALVTGQVQADVVVVTNLLRDQLDRYHELEQLAGAIKIALAHTPDAALVLNADDSLVTSLGDGRSTVRYFGLARTPWSQETTREVLEGHICPHCHQPLGFKFYHYSHLGDYFCPRCSYRRPRAEYEGRGLQLKPGGTDFNLVHPGGALFLHTPMPGIYNVYNILAAAGTALYLGVEPATIVRVVASFLPGQGRAEAFNLRDRRITLMLVKNPTGMGVALRTLATGRQKMAFLLAINDLAADGRDVSWLWDADLTPLLAVRGNPIICAGLRAGDMAICLKYQGIKAADLEVIPDPAASIECLLAKPVKEALILCTYTNLAVYRRLLQHRGARSEVTPGTSLPGVS